MSTHSSNPFDDAFANLEPPRFEAQSKAAQQERWEHRVVGKMLTHFSATQFAGALTEASGGPKWRFEGFKRVFPSFPIWLAMRKIPWAAETTVSDFAKNFTKTRIFKAFEEVEVDAPAAFRGGRFGLVFEWLHTWPTAIIHNFYHSLNATGTIIQHYSGKEKERFAVQSFESFLQSLPWLPDR